MRTDIAVEKLCSLAPIISELSEKLSKDKEFKTFMQSYNDERTNRVFVFKVLPLLIKNYHEEAFEMLAIWYEKSVDEVKAQPFSVTVEEVKKIFSDKDFLGFFSSSSASGSVADK